MGKSLSCALEDDVKGLFLELALGCASVICCHSSPKQKALVSFSFFFYVLYIFSSGVCVNQCILLLFNFLCLAQSFMSNSES